MANVCSSETCLARAQAAGFEQGPDMMAVTEGPRTRLVAANAAMREFLGRDVAGEPLLEAMPEFGAQQIAGLYTEVFRTGEPRSFKEWRLQVDRPDGATTEVFVDLVITPRCDDRGEVVGTIARATDVTSLVQERMAAEARSTDAESRYLGVMDLMTRMQDALLPHDLPVLPSLDVAARYLLAADDISAGGDWFDAVVRPRGNVALVVGDVVGHGVAGSAVMGQLRAVAHERLLGEEPVDAVLTALDRFARLRPESYSATVCVMQIDPGTGTATYCTAGHPPPLVVSATGETRFLPPTGAGPLGTGTEFTVAHDHLDPGDLVLLYTDGIMERPRRTVSQATAELSRTASDTAMNRSLKVGASARPAERVCQLGLEMLTRITGYADDITLLAAQRTTAPLPYEHRFPAERESVPQTRREFAEWLRRLEVSMLDEMAVLHAVAELTINAVEHSGAPYYEVTADLKADGHLLCTVRDTGRWREPTRDTTRGRGLAMARGLVDTLQISHDDTGTTASFRHRLTRSAQLLSGGHTAASSGPGAEVPFSVETDRDTARVHGPVDLVNADRLRAALLRSSRGGSAPMTVDLSKVTHLGSAGVQVLHDLTTDAALTVYAPAGSVAQHVLELVNLAYQTDLPER